MLDLFIGGENLGRTIEGRLKARISQSCFFMPCAPQSIRDEDQSYALFAGLLLVIGVEVVWPSISELKRRYRENRAIVSLVESTFSPFRMRRGGGEALDMT
jgi:hypothetical protein